MAGRSARRDGATDRIAAMVDEKLQLGLEYEAMQLFRGRAARKAAKGDFHGAAAIADAGATELMRRGYVDAATELGGHMVDILATNHLPPNEERIARIAALNALFDEAKKKAKAEQAKAEQESSNGGRDGAENGAPASAGGRSAGKASGAAEGASSAGDAPATKREREPSKLPASQLQIRFLKAAVKWSHAEGERVNGDPELAAMLGRAQLEQGEVDTAIRYLAVGEKPLEMVDGIWAASPGGSRAQKAAREQRCARGILHLLAMGNMRDANAALDRVRERLGKDTEPPLIVFCGMLLLTCERYAPNVYTKLLEMFNGNLSLDPKLGGYLHTIGHKYFDIQPPKTMMDNIMSMLTG